LAGHISRLENSSHLEAIRVGNPAEWGENAVTKGNIMGEYLYNSKRKNLCKLGTCEDWRYVRRDECLALRAMGYVYDSWDYIDRNDRKGPIFRFPWPHEDDPIALTDALGGAAIVEAVNNRDMSFNCCYPMAAELAFEIEHGDYCHSPKGNYSRESLSCNGNWFLPCPNSKEASEIGHWSNGDRRYQIQIIGERQNPNGWYTVFGCPYCDFHFALLAEEIAKVGLPQDILERVRPFIPTGED